MWPMNKSDGSQSRRLTSPLSRTLMDSNTSFEPTTVPHPGETVQEYLDFFEWSQRDLSRRTGLTPKTISEIINGKGPITPTTALAFEKAFQRPAHLWLNLQRQFDEVEARQREAVKATGWDEWVRNFPLKEMRQLHFSVPEGRSDADALLAFFGVTSPDSWSSVCQASAVHYRQTSERTVQEHAVAAWGRQTEIIAREIDIAELDAAGLGAQIHSFGGATRNRIGDAPDGMETNRGRGG